MKIRDYILFLAVVTFSATCFASVKGEVKKGNASYGKEKFDEALKHYEKAADNAPESDVVNFNLGAGFYKTGDYEKAVEHFQRALVSEDKSLEQKAQYNTGNAKYRYGLSSEDSDIQTAVSLLEQSLSHYERSMEIEEADEDAAFNYEFVKKELERLKEKMQRQESQSQESSDTDKDSQSKDSQDNKEKSQQQDNQANKDNSGEPQKGDSNKDVQPFDSQDKDSSQSSADTDKGEEMSQEQALMLLESYGQNEEPKELYKGKIPMRKLPDVLKDW